MTENGAKIIVEGFLGDDEVINEALEMAVKALEEIQAYRAMEEKLNGISVEQVVNGFINRVEKGTHEGYEKGRILTNAEADEWNAYRAIGLTPELIEAMQGHNVALINDLGEYQLIGTVDELKALKEKEQQRINIWLKDNYNDAITEFVARMKKRYPLAENDLFTINDTLHRALDEIAEEMRCAE